MAACLLCESRLVRALLDFGRQPVCSHFPARPSGREQRFPLGLSQCRRCGLLQLARPAPPSVLRARHAWISYREPEGHLDRLAATLLAMFRFPPTARVVGVSYKDTSLLRRLDKLGLHHTRMIRPREDLGIASPRAGLETIQDRLDPGRTRAFAAAHGQADLVIARHILEHAHDLRRFAAALRFLLKPGGALAIEVPDFSTARDRRDYATIWEEHTAYFTPATLRSAMAALGFTLGTVLRYPYPLENSLVAVAVNLPGRPWAPPPRAALDAELRKAQAYAAGFAPRRARLAARLERARREHGPVALFGAGHQAAKFVNLMDLGKWIAFVADDHPDKQGRFMPGSRLPILPGSALLERKVRLCLLALSPESEARVIRNYQGFLDAGGCFASIFPGSPKALNY